MIKDETLMLIEELEKQKKDYKDCDSTNEVLLVREWNKAVDECINVIANKHA